MTQAPTPISAASTAGKGSATPRHSLGAVSGAPTRRTLILDYIARVYPCGELPVGALTDIGEVFGITRERVRQIANQAGVGRIYWHRTPKPAPTCRDCDRPTPSRYHRYCEEHALIALTCAACTQEFQINRSQLKQRLSQGGRGRKAAQFFCSKKCSGSWAGTNFGFAIHGKGSGAINKAKTHCKWGHEFTPDNTYTFLCKNGTIGRQCKTCNKLRNREKYRRESLPNPLRTSGTNWTPNSEPAPVQAGSSVTPASTSGAQP